MDAILSKTYRCYIEDFHDGQDYSETIVEKSASKARYAFYRLAEFETPYGEMFKIIKVKTIGKTRISDFFGDKHQFNSVCERRGIEFVKQGMTIDVDGKKGIIVGGNNHLNLDVVMEGTIYAQNCHPTWETTYYDENMNIIKDFKK